MPWFLRFLLATRAVKLVNSARPLADAATFTGYPPAPTAPGARVTYAALRRLRQGCCPPSARASLASASTTLCDTASRTIDAAAATDRSSADAAAVASARFPDCERDRSA